MQTAEASTRVGAASWSFRLPRFFWLFAATFAVVAYLVVPPFFFILKSSLTTELGPDAGALTGQHYAAIFALLEDFRTLVWNSFVFSVGSSLGALLIGTLLAWLAERTNAPFQSLAYVSAFISFGLETL